MPESSRVIFGDAVDALNDIERNSIAACITDPPYNYEFIGHKWNNEEIERRMQRVASANSSTLVKNIPYGSQLAGGVRNRRWYERVQENIDAYQEWCLSWAEPLFSSCIPGAPVAVFNSTRTAAHVQIALERAGFYARDILVYRRHSGIPKGLNLGAKLRKQNHPDAEEWDGWHSCFRNEWEAIVLVQKPIENNYENNIKKYGIGLFNTKSDDGSFLSNIIEGASSRKKSVEKALHINEKPQALMDRLIKMLVPCRQDHVVIDPFCGSGTTLVAAKKYGVNYIGIDNDKKCIDISIDRLNKI
ncbi:DNA methyltransferase [Acetobacter senegalensis]|uniref:Methyltransferase n=1 Tax=Acetobacter senegalensis TaxID=446692 RepID=A0A149U3L9_9PROT|nr:DNA methyltransferase [Acetobacter senegalensis]KXV60075.1 DNA methyltransferase [Acetobacter senegalensis]